MVQHYSAMLWTLLRRDSAAGLAVLQGRPMTGATYHREVSFPSLLHPLVFVANADVVVRLAEAGQVFRCKIHHDVPCRNRLSEDVPTLDQEN